MAKVDVSIFLEGDYYRKDHFLYIPCKSTGEEGYFCWDGLGLPLGYELLEDGDKAYWFGLKEAGCFWMSPVVSVRISVRIGKNGKFSLVSITGHNFKTNTYVYWSFRLNMHDGTYQLVTPVIGDNNWHLLQRIPEDKLAKYYLFC